MLADTTTALQEVRNLWALLFLEEVASPDDGQLTMWLLLHDAETVKKGIAHLAAKYKQLRLGTWVPLRIKFCSSVMNRIEQEQKQVSTLPPGARPNRKGGNMSSTYILTKEVHE